MMSACKYNFESLIPINIQLWPSEEVNIQNREFWIFTDSEGRNCFIIPNKQLKYTV